MFIIRIGKLYLSCFRSVPQRKRRRHGVMSVGFTLDLTPDFREANVFTSSHPDYAPIGQILTGLDDMEDFRGILDENHILYHITDVSQLSLSI